MASIVDRHATETGKQGGKRWQVRWRDDRNAQRRKAFAKKAEAERFASQIEHEINTGNYRDPGLVRSRSTNTHACGFSLRSSSAHRPTSSTREQSGTISCRFFVRRR